MFATIVVSLMLLAITTVIHYEVLAWLAGHLPGINVPPRAKLMVVILVAFFAHALEVVAYGVACYLLVSAFGAGTLGAAGELTLVDAVYFSAETYTSLGFGDIVPSGPIRLIAGVEALNGLLLIGWSASFIYISMERYWRAGSPPRR